MVIVLCCQWPCCHCSPGRYFLKVKCSSTLTSLPAKHWQHWLHDNFAEDTEHHWHLFCSLVDIFILGNPSDNMIKVPDRRPIGLPYWKTKHMWGQKSSRDFSATVLMRNDKGWNTRWKINSTGGLVQHLIKQSICFSFGCIFLGYR